VRERAGQTSKIRFFIEPFDVRATFVSSFEKGVTTESFVLMDRPPKNESLDFGPLKIMSSQLEINGKSISAK